MQIGSSTSFSMPSQAMREKLFSRADANGDKQLSLEEFKAAKPSGGPRGVSSIGGAPSAEQMFSKLDANGDGALSSDEMDSGMKRMASAMQKAMTQHAQGDSSSLTELLFGNKDDDAQETTASEDASAASLKQRQLQWILDAFVSQQKANAVSATSV